MPTQTTFRQLANTRNEFDLLLSRCGTTSVNNNRIHRAYNMVTELADLVDNNKHPNSDIEWEKYAEQHSMAEPLQALLDVKDIHNFLPYISGVSDLILKEKLKRLLDGPFMMLNESSTTNTSEPRNTQFELLLFGLLRRAGYNAELCDPRPDIKVYSGNLEFFIECKRILNLSEASINRNTKEAYRQLNIQMDRNNKNQFGAIAISVQRLIVKPEEILNSPSPMNGLNFIKKLSEDFILKYGKIWHNPSRIKNSRIASVWVHYAGGVISKQFSPPLNMLTNTTMTNAWHDSRNLKVFIETFNDMESKLIES